MLAVTVLRRPGACGGMVISPIPRRWRVSEATAYRYFPDLISLLRAAVMTEPPASPPPRPASFRASGKPPA